MPKKWSRLKKKMNPLTISHDLRKCTTIQCLQIITAIFLGPLCLFYLCIFWTDQLPLLWSTLSVANPGCPAANSLLDHYSNISRNAFTVKQPVKLATLHSLPLGHHGCFHFSTNARFVTSRIVFSFYFSVAVFIFTRYVEACLNFMQQSPWCRAQLQNKVQLPRALTVILAVHRHSLWITRKHIVLYELSRVCNVCRDIWGISMCYKCI